MIREITKDADGRISAVDYALVSSFWTLRGGKAPARGVFPGVGVLFDHDACGFLYLDATGSGVAVIAWTATNPTIPPRRAAKALNHVITMLEVLAKVHGYHTILCHQVENSGLHRSFSRKGYTAADSNLVQLFRSID